MISVIKIKLADINDYEDILKIYEKYINDTLITFECKVPTIEEFANRLDNIQKTFPLFVCKMENKVAGYAYISRFRDREAYDWTVESSIYISSKYHGMNIGKAMYHALIEISKISGYKNLIGVVTMPNIKSEKLHAHFGFEEVGILKNVGNKNGNWADVKYYSLKLSEYNLNPEKPKPISEIMNSNELSNILKIAEQMININ